MIGDLKEGDICHDYTGEGDTGASQIEERQISRALNKDRHLPTNLFKEQGLFNLEERWSQWVNT